MELLDGKVLTGLNGITIGGKMPIESDSEKTSINFKSTSIENRKIIGRWNVLGKNTEEITLDLNVNYNLNTKLYFRHESNPSTEKASLLRLNSGVNSIVFTFVNYDKAGMTTWTKNPILLFLIAGKEGPVLANTKVTLDFVMQRLTQEEDAEEIFWQYYFTLCESTSYTVPEEGPK